MQVHNSYSELPSAFFTRVQPTPLQNPKLVSLNRPLAEAMGLTEEQLEPETLAQLGSGQTLWQGMDPLAQKYTGHQFGFYNPELGDGRGLLLWETLDTQGRRWEWHLKGAGQTPYSRFADGRAVLRSSIREYLASEALNALGIPTTRALFLTSASDTVYRETPETAATLMRVARTHLRFGHFEFAAYHRGEHELKQLADYAIRSCYPELDSLPAPQRYSRLLELMIDRTARLIAQWQAVGFTHGVMNTDNMSILGETFDYGPYAFMDDFEAGLISNHTDAGGRYAFNRQPEIGFWNCQCLARAVRPLIDDDDAVMNALRVYERTYNEQFLALMGQKLGLAEATRDDLPLIMDLFRLLHVNHTDYGIFFRRLSDADSPPVRDLFPDRNAYDAWAQRYHERLAQDGMADSERRTRMRAVNPKYVLRNYLLQQAIERAQAGDFSEVDRLLELVQHPFDERPEFEDYAALPPDWGKHLEISCSS